MSWLRYLRRPERDRDFALEIEAYLQHEIDDNIARGMNPREAAFAAQRKFGNVTVAKENTHRMNTIGSLETLGQDLRYAARLLRLEPSFFSVAILCLALGIGANTAIFHLLDAVRLQTLPVPNPRELVEVEIGPDQHCCSGNFSSRRSNFTYALWDQLRTHQQAFSGVFAWAAYRFNTTTGGEVRYVQGLYASGDFFRTLGVLPALGRVFSTEDDRPGCGSPGAVLSYSYWQREYGGQASAVGHKILLEGKPIEIIGVAQAGFFGVEVGRSFDVAIPVCAEPLVNGEDAHTPKRNHWWLAVIGRLKPGWSLTQVRAHVRAISPGLFEATLPPNYTPEGAKYYLAYKLTANPAESGVSDLREDYQDPLLILLAIAALVLVIACANLANLMLARATARERELAVRLAIGASRPRLIRQMLAESLLLAAIGAACGALLAQFLSSYLVRFLTTNDSPLYVDLGTDWRIFGFTAALAVLTCLLFGLMPAIRATRANPGTLMKASGRGLTDARERFGVRRILVVAQVGLSLVLLVGALLFVRSLHKLLTLDAGFQESGVLVTEIDYSTLQYSPQRRWELQREIVRRFRLLPGVEQAGATTDVPISGDRWNDQFEFVGANPAGKFLSNFSGITPGYFRTLGTPLLAGRDFDERDTPNSPKVAIVNQSFIKQFLNGANPIGKRIRIETGPGEPETVYQVVGITKDAKYRRLRDPFSPTVFTSLDQMAEPEVQTSGTNILSRSQVALTSQLAAIKREMAAISPSMALKFYTLHCGIADSLLRERLMATLSGFFGFLAALLASIGLYGVMAYIVARRRGEIGIRIALGADRANVLKLIGNECGKLLVGGLLLGVGFALAASQAITKLLYGLSPTDPLTIVLSVLLLALVALPASLIPAIRASRLDPMQALREE
jgi:putative ABC transport system permease protein